MKREEDERPRRRRAEGAIRIAPLSSFVTPFRSLEHEARTVAVRSQRTSGVALGLPQGEDMHAAHILPRRCTCASAVALLVAATLFSAGLAHG